MKAGFWRLALLRWRGQTPLLRAPRSVRGKLTRIVVVTTAMALLAAGAAMLTHDLSAYTESWASDLDTQSSILATATSRALAVDDRATTDRIFAALEMRPQLLVAALYSADGRLYSKFVRPGNTPPPSHLIATSRLIHAAVGDVELRQPIFEGGVQRGTIYLRSHHDMMRRANAYLGIFGLVTLGSLLVALGLSTALQRVITEPLDAMATVAREVVNRRDYSLRAHKSSNDEIGLVVDAFNSMLDEVQARARALEQSNLALQGEIETRQTTEAALERANSRLEKTMQALREADRRKDEFLATLAHELRNPLAPITHAVKLMEAPAADERQRQWGREVIARQVQRMALLLDDLLDVSRITRGRLDLRKDYIDLRSLVSSAVETARPLVDAKGHTLAIDLPPTTVPLEVDPLRMSQALSNLLTNAAKYTDAGGRITLSASLEAGGLTIRVADTGIGIDPAVIDGLFEMFSQIDSAIDRAEGGLGIGLSLVKGLVGLHGGSVSAASAGLGKGSVFTVHLPPSSVVAAPREAATCAPTAGLEVGPKCKILVADDNRDAADSLELLLRFSGYETAVAYTGKQTLDMALRDRPSVFILDIGMPDMTGYDVARRIRSQAWGRHALLIAVTGWGQHDDKERARAAGFDEHFTKPVNPEQLEGVLATFLMRLRPATSEEAGSGAGRSAF